MANTVTLSDRDFSLLRLLDMTPATASLVLKASTTFAGEPFRDERRVRERLQALVDYRLVRAFPAVHGVGGLMNWYKLTADGFAYVHGAEHPKPHRSRFEEISPTRFEHTRTVAEVIVHSLAAAHQYRIQVTGFHGEGGLVLETDSSRQVPDCHFQFATGGKTFNVLFEIDNSTEPLTSERIQSIRSKIRGYEAYQDAIWYGWKQAGETGQRPYFRVVFLTKTMERSHHILWLAHECARNKDRRLCYAAIQETYLSTGDAIQSPIFNDHHGHWQSLVNLHPSAKFLRTPIRLSVPIGTFPGV